jgi:dihydroflavonol-4-reductase
MSDFSLERLAKNGCIPHDAHVRFLITGANGFLGSHLAKGLLAEGHRVRALLRKTSDDALLRPLEGLERAFGDVTDVASLKSAMDGIDGVFHLAGIRRSPTREDFFRVHVEGTRHVCEAMLGTRARRLVFCGSLAASGPSLPDRPKREEDPFTPHEWYGESKAEAEKVAFSYQDRLEVTCIRPSRILGEGDRENLPFFKLAKKGLRLKLGRADRQFSFVDVKDVVTLLTLLATRKEAVGQAFFCSFPQTWTLEGLLGLVAQTLGVPSREVFVPAFALRALAGLADGVSLATGKHLPLNRKLARQLLASGWACSTEKAQRVLGFTAQVSIEEAVRQSAEGYQAQGLL